MNKLIKTTLVVALGVAAGAANADKLYLKSGSVLSGSVVGVDGGKVKFTSDDLGDIAVETGVVSRVETPAKKNLAPAEIPPVPKAPETWHGSVNAGFQAARGNTYENSGSLVANLNRRWEKDRLNLDFGYYYAEDAVNGAEKEKTEDRWMAEAKHDHFWATKAYTYEDLKWERDEIQDLDSRYRVGFGAGYQWLENSVFASTGKWSFNQEFGLNWVKEEYANGGDAAAGGFCALRYGHHLNYFPKWVEGLEFFHTLEVLPDVGDWEKFLANADVGFTTELIWNFDLIAKIEWEYNSMPANNRKKNDHRYIVGLGYKW